MSNNSNNYAEFYTHKMVVDYLKEDGALCDSSSKTYDINGTAEGGEGGRLAFKKINDKINQYHEILKFLNGEERANIYESVPVIDFVHKENTGFLESYYSDESGLYSMIIKDVPLQTSKEDIDLIKERDPYTINRALAGLTMSEHFYNVSGREVEGFNLKVGVPDLSKPDYLYKGAKSFRNPIEPNNENISSTYYPAMNVWKIPESTYLYFKADEENVTFPEIPSPKTENITDMGNNEFAMKFKGSSTYILNTSLDDGFFQDVDPNYRSYKFKTKNNERLINEKSDTEYYELKLNRDDILILIPSSPYSRDTNKFILITRDIYGNLVSYVLFFIDAVGIPSAYQCEEVYYGDSLPFKTLKLEGKEAQNFVSILDVFVTLEEVYYSDASGLLNGYFCSPKDIEPNEEYRSITQGRRVTKWKFTKPNGRSDDSYFIGKIDNKGAFLSRGNILAEPLKLTAHDSVIIDSSLGINTIKGIAALTKAGYNGKSQVYYQSLLNRDSIFVQAFSTELDFSDWTSINNTPFTLCNVVTFDDIKNSRNNVKYAKKMQTEISYDAFDSYIENFSSALKPNGLLELYSDSSSVSVEETTSHKRFLIGDKRTGSYTPISSEMNTYLMECFNIKYNLRDDGTFRVDDNNIKMISPYELFLPNDSRYSKPELNHIYVTSTYIDEETGDEITVVDVDEYEEIWEANPILLYPSNEEEYPFGMILLSRKDILDRYDVVSFWNNTQKKYLMMEVANKKSCIPSEITNVHYHGIEITSNSTIDKTCDYRPIYTEKLKTEIIEYDPVYKRVWTPYKVSEETVHISANYEESESPYTLDAATLGMGIFEIGIGDEFSSEDKHDWSIGNRKNLNYLFVVESVNIEGDEATGTLYEINTDFDVLPQEGNVIYYDSNGQVVFNEEDAATKKVVTQVDSESYSYTYQTFNYHWTDSDEVDYYNEKRYEDTKEYRILDKSHDCYIYYLYPKKITFDEKNLGVSFYDGDDKKINIGEDVFTSYMIPTVNKKEYFELLEPDETKPNQYFLKNGPRDVDILRNSVVITKMPKLVNSTGTVGMRTLRDKKDLITSESLREFYGAFLDSYKDENNKGQFQEILLRLYRYLLGSLKLSDSDTNPLYFRELRTTISNLCNLVPLLRETLNSGLQVRTDEGEVRILTLEDIQGLERRAHNHDEYKLTSINITDPDFSSLDFDPTSNLTDALASLLTHTAGRNDFIKVESVESSITKYWASYDEMTSALTSYESNMSMDCAKLLDKYFGSGTYPFLRMSQDDLNSNSILNPFAVKYQNIVVDTIYEAVKFYNQVSIAPYLATLKSAYKKYFTDETVEQAINANGDIDDTLLEFKIWENESQGILNENFRRIYLSYHNSLNWAMKMLIPKGLVESVIPEILSDKNNFLYDTIHKGLMTEANTQLKEARDAFNTACPPRLTKEDVVSYIQGNDTPLYMNLEDNKFRVFLKLPVAVISSTDAELQVAPNKSPILLAEFNYRYAPTDIERSVFESLLNYIKYALSGVDDTVPNSIKPSMGVEMSDNNNVPRPESLYGMRYKILNSRMNRVNGPLWNAASTLMNNSFFEDYKKISNNTIDSYSMFADVLPIAKMDKMTYLPERDATMTSVPLKGKYYSDEEMESLRNLINSQCVLTCTKCKVKDSCPFYDQKEVIDMACTPMETIDIYLKDNELELLVEDSIELQKGKNTDSSVLEGDYFDLDKLRTSHLEYGEILARKSENNRTTRYDVLDIDTLNEELLRTTGLGYNDFVSDDMRWLLGGRYGTIEYNGVLRDLILGSYPELNDKIPTYRYCYDALFMNITGNDNSKVSKLEDKVPYMLEDSYIGYRESANAYPVSYELGPREQKKRYNVKTKIKIPAYIKMLHNANDSDDVYLVSDDTKDPDGRPIDPVIYLGKVKDIQYTFDIIEDDPESSQGVTDPDDTNVYASDVAQWCINYMKGHCTDDPVGEPEQWHNRDQYWMPFVYKELYDEKGRPYWSRFPGRPRIDSGYQEPTVDVEDYDDITAISGKPVINTYYDFVRKVSIRIYDPNIADENSRWLIPWVNENMPPQIPDKSITTLEKKKEFQRTVLPLMKTNLRLVVIKS